MQVTFDKGSKKLITDAFGTLRGKNCYFCGTPLNQKNFSGVYKLKEKAIFFDGSLPCLIGLVDLRKANKHE